MPRKASKRSAAALVFTEREVQIWRLICAPDEPSPKQLPELLGITYKTVITHLTKLYAKLKVRTRIGLMRAAIAHGIIPCPCPRCAQPKD